MDSDAAGTSGERRLTSGGAGVTSGNAAHSTRRLMLAGIVLFAAVQGTVNGVSRLSDLRGAGSDIAGWMIAVDESTSFVSWLVCMVVIWRLVAVLRPSLLRWPLAILVHALATIPVSLLHIGLMVALREGAYVLGGVDYDFAHDGLWTELVYEYRKDAPVYGLLASAFAAIRWVTREAPEVAGQVAVLTLQDGTARHRIPVDTIDLIEAAGNYVTIHWQGQELLQRTTLGAMAERLGNGFARIHRSRLVRRAAIRTVETLPSGDFTVTLSDGTQTRGSRRYRDALD